MRRERWGLAICLLGWALFCLLEGVFLALDEAPPRWDQSWHLTLALPYLRLLWPPSLGKFLSLPFVSQFYPPLYHLSAAPFLALFGLEHKAACLTNLAYALCLSLSVYLLGRLLFPPPLAGLASWLALFTPYFLPTGHEFLIDFGLACFTPLSIWLLLRTDGFRRPLESALFGVSFAIGMLLKWSYAYVVGPLLVWQMARCVRHRREWGLSRLGLAATYAVVFTLPWYGPNCVAVIRNLLQSNTSAFVDRDPMWFTFGWFTYYLQRLFDTQLFLPLALLGLAGFALAVARRDVRMLPFAFWLFGGMAALTTVLNKDPRFSAPLLPAMAIAMVYALSSLRGKVRSAMCGFVAAWALGQSLLVQFPPRWLPERVGPSHFPLLSKRTQFSRPPRREDWKVDEILDVVERTAGSKDFCLGVLANHPNFEPLLFRYAQMARHFDELIPWMPCVRILGQNPAKVYDELFEVDFLVVKTGDQGPPQHARLIYETFKRMRESRGEFERSFELIARFPLPDGSEALVYRNVNRVRRRPRR